MKKSLTVIFLLGLIAVSCTNSKNKSMEIEKLKMENDSLKHSIEQKENNLDQKITTFLTFQKGNAEQAINFYIELFDNSKIIDIKRWGKDTPGIEGKIMHATFEINGQLYMCSDSPQMHDWDFTPAVSNFVQCEDEKEIEQLFTKLAEKGETLMPLNNYGFSQKFAWVVDQFGVSWQLNLQ